MAIPVAIKDRHLAGLDPRRQLQLGDVARHHVMPHGIVERMTDHAMGVHDGARRDATLASAPATGLKRGVPLLDVDGRELLHEPGADVGADLPVEQLAVPLRRPGRIASEASQ